jgi:hypothetical protein
MACAIALGMVEQPGVSASLEAITILDDNWQPLGTQTNWLGNEDPLEIATQEFLLARRDLMAANVLRWNGGLWTAAQHVKSREAALVRSNQARLRCRILLAERGILVQARAAGRAVID